MTGEQLIRKAAAMRGNGHLQDAINEINNNRTAFDDITLVPALLQAFYAAKELDDTAQATTFAKELAALEPDIPSIQDYL